VIFADEILKNPAMGVFWTSGSDLDSPGNYTWCEIRTPITNNIPWIPDDAIKKDRGQHNCILAVFNTKKYPNTLGIITESCKVRYNFLCEVNYYWFDVIFVFSNIYIYILFFSLS
jgi:hypothetical protein